MAINRIHGVWAVEADSTLVSGITGRRGSTGTETQGEPASGLVYPQNIYIRGQQPVFDFGTKSIANALDTLGGLIGKNIADLAAGFKMYLEKRAAGSTRASGANHRKLTATAGLILPRSLSVEHQGDAVLSYDVVPVYDGVNDPVAITDSVSLPAGLTDSDRWTLGPFTIESIALGQAQSLNIDFGISEQLHAGDSDIWATMVSIARIQPVLTLTGTDIEWFKSTNFPLAGKAATHANTTIYLRHRAGGSTYVANGTATHIKFTADGLAYIDTFADASGDAPDSISLTMPLRYDGTNAPLTVDTTSAIS